MTQAVAGVQQELALVLRTGPFPLALRTAIAVRGLPLQQIQHRLAQHGVTVGVTSLSYWQQGARTPRRPESLRAVRALEDVLELPRRSLVRLLGSPVPGGLTDSGGPDGAPAPAAYRPPPGPAGAVARMRAELERPADDGLHTVVHSERVRIGPRRELLGRLSQQVLRAHRDGVDRFLAVHRGDPGCSPKHVRVRATENCRTGRVRRDESTGVVLAELLFDTRLHADETYVIGYGFEDGTAGESAAYQRDFARPGAQYVLQVAFDQAALPARCRRYRRPAAEAPHAGETEPAPVGHHRTVHVVELLTAPGVVGIGWDWD